MREKRVDTRTMPRLYVPDFKHREGLRQRLKDVYLRVLGLPFYQRRVEAHILFGCLGNIDGKRVLNIGCGDGIFDIEMARRGAKIEAIDLCRGALERARWRADQLGLALNINFVHGNATHLPYRDSTFDVVISNCVIEHIPADQQVLKEVSRLLKPAGKLVITVPREFENWDRIPARLAKLLISAPNWLKRKICSDPIIQATSFRGYVDLVLVPYKQVRVGYSEAEIEEKMGLAGLRLIGVKGYLKMYGAWGVDVLEGFSALKVVYGGDFGYMAKHDWLYGLLFPVLYLISFLDDTLGRKAPSMAMIVTTEKRD